VLSGSLALLFMLLLAGPAQAFSRIVVMAQGAGGVTLDGVRQNVISGRTVIHPVTAGPHRLAVQGPDGKTLHSELLLIPDGVQVRVSWTSGAPFEVKGASSSQESAQSHEVDSATGVKPKKPGIGRSPDGGTTSRGSLGPASGPRASDLLMPRSSSSSPTSPRAAATQALGAISSGAHAGTSFGSRAFSQKIKRPNVVYGSVNLIKSSGPACRIYDGGMLVAELQAGASSVQASLEVGRRQLEFRDMASHTLWHSGELQLDAQHTVQLVFDDASVPTPKARAWLWQGL
jgi:hypothetical protein